MSSTSDDGFNSCVLLTPGMRELSTLRTDAVTVLWDSAESTAPVPELSLHFWLMRLLMPSPPEVWCCVSTSAISNWCVTGTWVDNEEWLSWLTSLMPLSPPYSTFSLGACNNARLSSSDWGVSFGSRRCRRVGGRRFAWMRARSYNTSC